MSNAKVQKFVTAGVTFEASGAQGCYVEAGSADSAGVVDRMDVLPTGAILDLDGTADAALTPGVVWQRFVFVAAHPNGHVQYKNLLACVGKHGVLTLETPAATGVVTVTVAARLRPLQGSWEAPYRVGERNTLVIRAEWQLKGLV